VIIKRNIFILLLFVCGTVAMTAQNRLPHREIYIGGTGGVSASQIGFQPEVYQSYLFGYCSGATFRYIGDEYFGWQLELRAAQMGWKEVEKIENKNYFLFSRQTTYLQIPFLTHIYFGRKMRVFVNLGPQIMFLLGSNASALPAAAEGEERYLRAPVSFDYGFAGGLGASVPIRRTAIELEARIYYGMNDMYPSVTAGTRSNNIGGVLSLGWFFKIGK